MVFPIVDAPLEQVFHRDALNPVHCEGLARASLTVGKDGHYALVEYEIKYWSDLVEVQLFV